MVVGHATDHLGSKLSSGVTGVLQSAFGNLPELFICIFSLRAGLVNVVKGALVGSILANSLLVLGAAILFGGLKHGTQTFRSEPPKMIVTLMMLATAALVIPSLVHWLDAPASKHCRIKSGLLVVSKDATTTGFLNLSPQNSTLVSAIDASFNAFRLTRPDISREF